MDRLPALIVLALLFAACDGGSSTAPAAPPPPRFEAVTAAPKKAASVDQICEQHPAADVAKTFALPTIDGPPMARGTGWTWVNLWATWCEPCVEEMPMLVRWQAKLVKEGVDVTLQFLSVDAKADDVTKFRTSHASTPPSMRLADLSTLAPWLTSVGLDQNAVIPVHLFVDPDQKIRCVRMGGLEEADYEAVKAVLQGE